MPQSSLLDHVRSAIRLRHCSIRTEEAYVNVIRRYILYHQKRLPKEVHPLLLIYWQQRCSFITNLNSSSAILALVTLCFIRTLGTVES